MSTGKRHELTDSAWAVIEPLLPQRSRGRPWKDHRRVINGILWVLATGVAWRDAPERYGPWQTLYDRFVRWTRDGTWDLILVALLRELEQRGQIDWELFCACGTSIRALKAAAGARGKNQDPGRARRPRPGTQPGGFGSKLHVVCDSQGTITAFCLTAGNVNECTEFVPLMESVSVPSGHGRS